MSEEKIAAFIFTVIFSAVVSLCFVVVYQTHQENLLERCLSAGMEYVDGNCTHSK